MYRKGSENTNADAFSRNPAPDNSYPVAATSSRFLTADINRTQLNDPVIKKIHDSLSNSPSVKPTDTNCKRYSLLLSDTYRSGINCLFLMVWYVELTSRDLFNTQ